MNLDKKIIDTLLAKSSFAGLLTLYFTKLRYDKKQGFDRIDLTKIRSGEYTYGYFIACASFGLFEYTRNKSIINITEFDSYCSENIYKKLIDLADTQEPKTSAEWKEDIKKVENI